MTAEVLQNYLGLAFVYSNAASIVMQKCNHVEGADEPLSKGGS